MTVSLRSAAAVILTANCVAGGCGKSDTGPSSLPAVLQIAGSYQIAQQQVTDTCGGGQPAAVTGTVTHTAGSNTFSLSDNGGTTFNGSVQNSGDFTANAVFGPDPDRPTRSSCRGGARNVIP